MNAITIFCLLVCASVAYASVLPGDLESVKQVQASETLETQESRWGGRGHYGGDHHGGGHYGHGGGHYGHGGGHHGGHHGHGHGGHYGK